MKFSMVFAEGSRKLVVTPETPAEQLLLAAIVDPNGRGGGSIDGVAVATSAEVTIKTSNDRIPYRKVEELYISL